MNRYSQEIYDTLKEQEYFESMLAQYQAEKRAKSKEESSADRTTD